MLRALHGAQQQIALRVRRLRQERGLTQEVAAERIGLSTIQLGRLERGEANVTLATLVACAVAFRIDVRDLLGDASS